MTESKLDLFPPNPDTRLQYGSDPLQFADVNFPAAAKPWPLVMNIHGGFWRAAYDLAHAGHFCSALAKAGFATFNVEYRRVGNPGGGWPGTLDDIRGAYSYIRRHAAEFGGDAEQLVVMGHSAGGHLAVCLASYEPSVRRVVPLAGVLDLERAHELHLSNDAAVEFVGGTPQQLPQIFRAASPVNLAVNARQMVITGTDDDTVPPEMSRAYVAKKKASGEDVSIVEIPRTNHMDLIDPRSEAIAVILQSIQKLLL